MIIRPEAPSDIPAISQVTQAAFLTLEISQNTEHLIIDALRKAGVLTLSLVAEDQGKIIGHIAFSPIIISDGTKEWYGLGPVSVAPERHGQGVGSALIKEGLSRLRDRGAKGCALVGNPEFYHRFGFQAEPDLIYEGVPPEFFMALAFQPPMPRGTVVFHPGFQAK